MTLSFDTGPTPALSPELFDRFKDRVEQTLVRIIRKNRNTRFIREAPVLNDFRGALDALGDTNDVTQDGSLVKSFRETIPLTVYDPYEPFVNKLVAPDPKEKDVKDMFSPGLPYFIAISSGTSGKRAKLFAKYRHTSGTSLLDVDRQANPTSDQGGKNCIVYSLVHKGIINVTNDEGSTVGQFFITPITAGAIRMQNGIDVHKDPWTIKYTAPRATSPIAVSFIVKYRSFLLMHALFALADPQLETINTAYGTVLVDMIRCMQEEWDTIIDSVEAGVLPNWEEIGHVRRYLEPKFTAKPERAAHLRLVGKAMDEPGWLKRLWPRLRVVIGTVSGVFSVVIPEMKHYIGPDVRMSSVGFTASEAYIGTACSSTDLSLYKACNDDVIEYLDVSKPDMASHLALGHEVEFGRRYEVVVTTRDGLWRYRIGDIVEIAGFDPIDGTPILRYIERRDTFARIAPIGTVRQAELAQAISSVHHTLGRIVEFTVVVDDRTVPWSWAFFVEIDGPLSASVNEAPAALETELRRLNEIIGILFDSGRLGSPTIHLLKAGTFRDYRGLKIETTITGAGQIKVPVVLWDKEVQEWMIGRVDRVITRC